MVRSPGSRTCAGWWAEGVWGEAGRGADQAVREEGWDGRVGAELARDTRQGMRPERVWVGSRITRRQCCAFMTVMGVDQDAREL